MAAVDRKLKVETRGDLETVMTRQFDAPRNLVFEAHSSCEHMSKWWGPRRYDITECDMDFPDGGEWGGPGAYGIQECDMDFRDGGKWRMVHRSPDGGPEFGFHGEYLEIVRP